MDRYIMDEFDNNIRDGLKTAFEDDNICVSEELIQSTLAAIKRMGTERPETEVVTGGAAEKQSEEKSESGDITDIQRLREKKQKRRRLIRYTASIAAAFAVVFIGYQAVMNGGTEDKMDTAVTYDSEVKRTKSALSITSKGDKKEIAGGVWEDAGKAYESEALYSATADTRVQQDDRDMSEETFPVESDGKTDDAADENDTSPRQKDSHENTNIENKYESGALERSLIEECHANNSGELYQLDSESRERFMRLYRDMTVQSEPATADSAIYDISSVKGMTVYSQDEAVKEYHVITNDYCYIIITSGNDEKLIEILSITDTDELIEKLGNIE